MHFMIALSLAVLAGSDPSVHRTEPVLVRGVPNGDTIEVSTYGRVRLLGTEGAGLSDGVLAMADARVRIDIEPTVDSLNVSVAAGIALHALRR